MSETVTLTGAEGARNDATAEVVRYSPVNRVVKASLFVLGGLLAATACIVIPIVHLFTTWGFPLLGILMAVRTMRREIVVTQVEGDCPTCGQKIGLPGGALNEPAWQVCPTCQAKLNVQVVAVPG